MAAEIEYNGLTTTPLTPPRLLLQLFYHYALLTDSVVSIAVTMNAFCYCEKQRDGPI